MALVSLFSGVGGLDWGFHILGMPLGFANDKKQDAGRTYALNFGTSLADGCCLEWGRFTVGDISAISFCGRRIPSVQILTGGPPCQDFSIMRGKSNERQGALTLRGKLYLQYARFLAILQPLAFVFENVPGLRSSNKGADIRAIVDDFTHLNLLPDRWKEQYRVAPKATPPPPEDILSLDARHVLSYFIAVKKIVDASAHGVPQKRQRLFIIGFRRDLPIGFEHISAIEEALNGSPALRKYPLSSLEALEGAVLTELEDEYLKIVRQYEGLFPGRSAVDDYLRLHGGQARDPLFERALEEHQTVLEQMGWKGTSLSQVGEDAFPDGSHVRARESRAVIERMKHIPPGENHTAVRGTTHEVEGRGFSLVYRRLHPLMPSYTVVAHGGGGTWGYHYRRELSRLTNRERARLQGFPDSFLFQGSTQEVRAQIGEAVPPLVSLSIARSLSAVLADLGVWELARQEEEEIARYT